jgi:hypothetical protein
LGCVQIVTIAIVTTALPHYHSHHHLISAFTTDKDTTIPQVVACVSFVWLVLLSTMSHKGVDEHFQLQQQQHVYPPAVAVAAAALSLVDEHAVKVATDALYEQELIADK